MRRWLARVDVQTLFIEPGSPWENSYSESFNGRLRDEYLNGERFDALIEAWRNEYNRIRPHSSLGYRSPAPGVVAGAPLLRDETLTLQVV